MQQKGVSTSNIIVSALFMLIGLFGIIIALSFYYWESMTLPLITSSLVFLLATWQIILDLRKRKLKGTPGKVADITANGTRSKIEIKRSVKYISWTIGFCLAIYLFGFYIAIPVFSIAYLKSHSRGWFTSILFAAIITGFVYLIFNTILKTVLYRGLVFIF